MDGCYVFPVFPTVKESFKRFPGTRLIQKSNWLFLFLSSIYWPSLIKNPLTRFWTILLPDRQIDTNSKVVCMCPLFNWVLIFPAMVQLMGASLWSQTNVYHITYWPATVLWSWLVSPSFSCSISPVQFLLTEQCYCQYDPLSLAVSDKDMKLDPPPQWCDVVVTYVLVVILHLLGRLSLLR